MLDDNIKKVIAQAFGMQGFGTGIHFYNNSEGKELRIDSIWVVELFSYFAGTPLIAGVRCEPHKESRGWYRGLLLVPPLWEPRNREFGGKEPLRVVDLTWPDPVTEALQSINIFPQRTLPGGELSEDYRLHTFIGGATGFFNHSGRATDPLLENFYKAILENIEMMADIYDDDEVKAFLKTRPFGG
jgi:hypothetical protein